MIYFIFILVIGLMLYYSKKKEEEMTEAMMTILTSIRNKKQLEDVPEILKEEYDRKVSIRAQEFTMNLLKEIKEMF